MKKIKLTESQIKSLEAKINKPSKVVMQITESQFGKITGRAGKFEKKIDKGFKDAKLTENVSSIQDMDDLEFFEEMIYFINNEFSEKGLNDDQGEESLLISQFGLNAKELKRLLIGHGVIKMVDGEIKIMKNGLSKALAKVKDELVKSKTPQEPKETEPKEEIVDDQVNEDYPAGAEQDSNAPYNQTEEPEIQYGYADVRILGNADDYALCNVDGSTVLAYIGDISNELNQTEQPEAILSHFFDDREFTDNAEQFLGADYDVIVLNGENMGVVINGLEDYPDVAHMVQSMGGNMISEEDKEEQGYDYSDEDIEYLDGEFENGGLAEMTTTGDVGGSYETPAAWSKDPKKPRHSDKTALAGGQFIAQQTGDKMSTIRENLINALPKIYSISEGKINEDITFRKGEGVIYMISDSDDPKVRSNETYKAKDYAKEYGFKWDKAKKVWFTTADNIEKVKELAKVIETCKDSFEDLEGIADMIQQMDGDRPEDVKEAEKTGAKLTSKEEVAQLFEDFYNTLDGDLDENQYLKINADYIKFVSRFKSKFGKNYSPRNLMLIFIQRPNASAVGTFNDWKKVKRMVKKGERSIKIWAPIIKDVNKEIKNSEEEFEKTGKEFTTKKDKELVGFKTMPVFDLSQTKNLDGSEDPTPLETSWSPSNDPNEKAQELAGVLRDIIVEDGIKVTDDESIGGEDGSSRNNWINISNGSVGERLFASLIHEYAHELLHWQKGPFAQGKKGELDYATQEIQAEGIAVGIMNHYGFDTTPGKVYLQSWRQKGKEGLVTIKSNIEIMTKVSGYIVGKMTEKLEAKHSGAGNRIVQPEVN